ncbi:hypothetical protein AAC691_08860 [Nguyenibacter vanlangensis]|uniref:Uncharacterized protein n=1 Tax=Nguyenibacter vanlangensis TaxID=1216886 RepID=A0ABZ3DAM7_9PROT
MSVPESGFQARSADHGVLLRVDFRGVPNSTGHGIVKTRPLHAMVTPVRLP